MLNSLKTDNIGWAKQIKNILENYGISLTFTEIQSMPFSKWKKTVNEVSDIKNRERLIEMCTGTKGEKYKTKRLLSKLEADNYKRSPCMNTLTKSRYFSRVRIMSMYHMLDCSKNYKIGNKGENCRTCNVTDDENHRINFCIKYQDKNLFQSPIKIDFNSIYSDNEETVGRMIEVVCKLWDLKLGKNTMDI